MKRPVILLFPVAFVLAMLWWTSAPAPAQGPLIDFETPSLGANPNEQIDPYVDASTGITFTVAEGNGVIGLVKNSFTSVCVTPSDDNQLLATGTDKSNIGLSGFPIRAQFPTVLQGPVQLSVYFQAGADTPLRVRLFDVTGKEVGSTLTNSGATGSNCGQNGGDRIRKQVTVSSTQPVAFALFDLDTATGGRVFAIDDLSIQAGAPTAIGVPRDEAAMDIDNVCGEKEYLNAAHYQYVDAFDTIGDLYIKHDGEQLYVCVQGVWGQLSERFFAVNLDQDLEQEDIPEKDDISLRAAVETSALSSYIGSGSARAPWSLADIRDWNASAAVDTNIDKDVAEFQIPLTLAGTTCGKPFGLGIYHQSVGTAGDHFGWPQQDHPDKPVTWVTARLVNPNNCDPTATPTDGPSATPSITATATQVATPTPTGTTPPTITPTNTRQPTNTATNTPTHTSTPVVTPGPTNTQIALTGPIVAAPYVPLVVATFVAVPTIQFPDVAIHGIELTQGVQCFDTSNGLNTCPDNSLPLVNKKDATARIYLKYNGPLNNGSLNNVPVRLYIRANNVWYEANASGKATTTINQANSDSADIYFNVNFTNDIVVDFYAEVDPNNNITESNENNNRFPANGFITRTFRKRDALKIVGQRTRYHPSGHTGGQYAGGWAVNGGAADYFEQLLPIRNNGINYSVKSGYLSWTKNLSSGDNQHDLIKTLNAQWLMQNAFSWLFGTGDFTDADHVYGWVDNDGYSGGHADMPVYPHAGGLGVVGIGTDRPGTDTDNPGGGALIFVHELLHDYDLKHTDTGGDDCGSNDSSSLFPYANSSIQEFGFNPITGKIYNPNNTHDVMSYCPAGGSRQGWISPYTWNYMSGRLDAAAVQAASQDGTLVRLGKENFRQVAESDLLVVNAAIFNPEAESFNPARAGQLYNLHLLNGTEGGATYLLPGEGYAVDLRKGEEVLATESFSVTFKSEYTAHTGGGEPGEDVPPFSPDDLTRADVSLLMEWVDGADTVVLRRGDTILAIERVSPNAPTIAFTSPTTAVAWSSGVTETVSWAGNDVDGDSLTYSLFYRYNDEEGNGEWELLATELTTTTYDVEVDQFAGSSDASFRVVATDGVNIAVAESAPVTIPNKEPVALIADPVNGASFIPGALIVFQGSALDLEDGRLGDEALTWSSDRQGNLGTGPSLPVNALEPGEHLITLQTQDSDGATATDTVTVFVGHKSYLPIVTR